MRYKNIHPVKIILGLMAVIAFIGLVSWVVMLLWNYSVAQVTGAGPIHFWQAVALLILSKILFGGLGRFGKHHRKGRRHWKQRWSSFSDEEKESFKAKWKARCEKRD